MSNIIHFPQRTPSVAAKMAAQIKKTYRSEGINVDDEIIDLAVADGQRLLDMWKDPIVYDANNTQLFTQEITERVTFTVLSAVTMLIEEKRNTATL